MNVYSDTRGVNVHPCWIVIVPILSPVTYSCPSWISGRERMVRATFSWPNLNERMFCRTWGSNARPSAYQADAHPIELPRPAKSMMWKWNSDWWQTLDTYSNELSLFRFVQILNGIIYYQFAVIWPMPRCRSNVIIYCLRQKKKRFIFYFVKKKKKKTSLQILYVLSRKGICKCRWHIDVETCCCRRHG